MKTLLPALVLSIGLTGCASGPESQESETAVTYAALAVVPGKGRMFHGYAKRQSRRAARTEARSKCSNYDCTVVQDYKSGQCVHIVLGNDQIYWNEENFNPGHRQDVLSFCNRIDDNCQVVVSECLP